MGMDNIVYNSKHLRKGDPLPVWTGKLRVYNMRVCPFAHRIILALNAKNLDYEVVNIDLTDKPEWLPSKSVLGKVPALEIEDGLCIYESLVMVEYLDDVYPQRPLISQDPVKKAFDKIIVEAADPIRTLYYKVIRFPETINEDNVTAYGKALDFIQEQLKNRGSKFLGGIEPGYADYMLWPWFERIITLDDERMKIKPPAHNLMVEYIDNMLKDPVVIRYLLPKDVYDKFHQVYKMGNFQVQILESLF